METWRTFIIWKFPEIRWLHLITFRKQASKDKKLLKNAGLGRRAKKLLNIIAINPFQNLPPYEKLLDNLRCTIPDGSIYNIDWFIK